MTPSLPCAKCGHIEDLETVIPLWTLGDKAVLWDCLCGRIRTVLINRHTPQALVRKAMETEEAETKYRKAG